MPSWITECVGRYKSEMLPPPMTRFYEMLIEQIVLKYFDYTVPMQKFPNILVDISKC